MKIVRQSDKQIFDYTCEEVKEATCQLCGTIFEYTESDFESLEVPAYLRYNPYKSEVYYVCCPYCKFVKMISW